MREQSGTSSLALDRSAFCLWVGRIAGFSAFVDSVDVVGDFLALRVTENIGRLPPNTFDTAQTA